MEINSINRCEKCGSTDSSKYSTLDFEERIVAERRAGKFYSDIKTDLVKVCRRCFMPLPESESLV